MIHLEVLNTKFKKITSTKKEIKWKLVLIRHEESGKRPTYLGGRDRERVGVSVHQFLCGRPRRSVG